MSHKNTLYTLINIPQDKIDPHYLAQKTIQNMKTKGLHLTEDDVEVVFATNYIATLDVDATINQLAAAKSGPMGVPKTPEDLPYKVNLLQEDLILLLIKILVGERSLVQNKEWVVNGKT